MDGSYVLSLVIHRNHLKRLFPNTALIMCIVNNYYLFLSLICIIRTFFGIIILVGSLSKKNIFKFPMNLMIIRALNV